MTEQTFITLYHTRDFLIVDVLKQFPRLNTQQAEDVVDAVFAHIWEIKDTITATQPRAYLWTAIRNKAVDELRRMKRVITPAQLQPASDSNRALAELAADDIHRAVATDKEQPGIKQLLSNNYRRIFQMSIEGQLSNPKKRGKRRYQPVIDEFNITPLAARLRVCRMRKKLTKLIA